MVTGVALRAAVPPGEGARVGRQNLLVLPARVRPALLEQRLLREEERAVRGAQSAQQGTRAAGDRDAVAHRLGRRVRRP